MYANHFENVIDKLIKGTDTTIVPPLLTPGEAIWGFDPAIW